LAEIDIARWLVFCVDNNDEPNIDDAVKMLTNLVTAVTDNPAMSLGAAPIKPVSLLVDSPVVVSEAVTEASSEPYVEDAPTLVAEEPTHEVADEPAPAFIEDEPTLIAEPETVVVDEIIVEAFFSDDVPEEEPRPLIQPTVDASPSATEGANDDDRPREDEIL
jgi:hypothetical protein